METTKIASDWDAPAALAFALKVLAEPRPDRGAYSRSPYGEDRYQLAWATWDARQRKARQLERLARKALEVRA